MPDPARILRFPGPTPPPEPPAPPRTDHAMLAFKQACERLALGAPGGSAEDVDATHAMTLEAFRPQLSPESFAAVERTLESAVLAAKTAALRRLAPHRSP